MYMEERHEEGGKRMDLLDDGVWWPHRRAWLAG